MRCRGSYRFGLVALSWAVSAGADPLVVIETDRGLDWQTRIVFAARPLGDDVRTFHGATDVVGEVRWDRVVLALGGAVGVTSFRGADRPQTTVVRTGNPTVAAHTALFRAEGQTLVGGLLVAVPVLTLPGTISTNTAARYVDAVALAATAFGRPWTWMENVVPLVVPFAFRHRFDERWSARVDFEPAWLVSVNARPSRAAVLASVLGEWRAGFIVPGVGVRAFGSGWLDVGRELGASVWSWLRVENAAWSLTLGMHLNVLGPNGAVASNATFWGTSCAIGFFR